MLFYISYIVKLVVVNAYLWSIDANGEFSLLKIRFVYTGAVILAWFFLTLLLVTLAYVSTTLPEDEPLPQFPTIWQRIGLFCNKSPRLRLSLILISYMISILIPLLFANRCLSGHFI